MAGGSHSIPTELAAAAEPDPAFILARPYRTVVARGAGRTFRSPAEAVSAMRGGEVSHIVGALPFAPGAPVALWSPESVSVEEAAYGASAAARPAFEFAAALPDPEVHVRRVAEAVRLLRDPAHPIRKVVLARSIRALAAQRVRPVEILDRLVSTDPMGNGFLVDLSAAGGRFAGRHLVGSSPEILVRRDGAEVLSYPLAGSARRNPEDERVDREVARTLLGSSKDQHEHRYVVDQVSAVLRDRCAEVHTPAPELTSTPEMWHLGTPITATVRADGPSALELAAALHPTPAICGTPTAEAARLITELEGDRGFYAGAVGWCDADGNGEWMVSIRCAELAADGRSLLAHAGGGIVAESDPAAELAETTAKFQRILRPLGISLPVTVA
ncbi:isochorismate synthase [Nocardia huaxiensis]|uniref:isochorismate synthase n=1 Tax=Nocardia huaxiensis TaxID=2755382 RepID=A0A7D6ZDV6_9NOCA|nr:isochorismate synthase [Nocardia huaxiensis]QLY33188.1 isochorismate synthase [Nocardia huaxiensis]